MLDVGFVANTALGPVLMASGLEDVKELTM